VRNVEPRYDQLTLNKEERHNKLQQVLSPNKNDAGVGYIKRLVPFG